MKCPKCKNVELVSLYKNNISNYCPSCQNVYMNEETIKESSKKESVTPMRYDGVEDAMKFIEKYLDKEYSIDNKTMILASLNSLLIAQWHEGFKTGILANLVKIKENMNGKVCSCKRGTEGRDQRGDCEDKRRGLQNGFQEDSGPKGFRGEALLVRERVNGIEFERGNVELTDKSYENLALLSKQIEDYLEHNLNNPSKIKKISLKDNHIQITLDSFLV